MLCIIVSIHCNGLPSSFETLYNSFSHLGNSLSKARQGALKVNEEKSQTSPIARSPTLMVTHPKHNVALVLHFIQPAILWLEPG